MRLPYSVQGAFFAPAFIGLVLILKVTCPVPTGSGCLTDHLAVLVFFPLNLVYKIFGQTPILSYELLLVLLYWMIIGFLVGLIFDLRTDQSLY